MGQLSGAGSKVALGMNGEELPRVHMVSSFALYPSASTGVSVFVVESSRMSGCRS